MVYVVYSSVQFVTLLKQNVIRGCRLVFEQVGFEPSLKLSSSGNSKSCPRALSGFGIFLRGDSN